MSQACPSFFIHLGRVLSGGLCRGLLTKHALADTLDPHPKRQTRKTRSAIAAAHDDAQACFVSAPPNWGQQYSDELSTLHIPALTTTINLSAGTLGH